MLCLCQLWEFSINDPELVENVDLSLWVKVRRRARSHSLLLACIHFGAPCSLTAMEALRHGPSCLQA